MTCSRRKSQCQSCINLLDARCTSSSCCVEPCRPKRGLPPQIRGILTLACIPVLERPAEKQPANSGRRKYSLFSVKRRLAKPSKITPVEETLRVFISLEGGLENPKDRLHNVRIHPRCRDLACFSTFGKVSRTSETFRGCAMYQLCLRCRDLM